MPISWRGGLVVVAAIGCGDSGTTQRDAGICTTFPCEETVSRYPLLGPIAVDMLWVIDNSGSMAEEVARLQDSFDVFMNEFVTLGLDYQIGVTTTDMVATDQSGRLPGPTETHTPRWSQAFSYDDGVTWETNWIMEFRRPARGTGKETTMTTVRDGVL